MNVGIIGAGVAGLAAARELQDHGHKVTVFESRHEVGGQVVTFPVGDGDLLECFYHHIFTNDTTVVRYINELGLRGKLHWIEPRNAHFVRGRAYPFVTPMDLVKFTAVPFISRVRLGLAALWLRRQKNWHKYEPITARKWMERAVGKKGYAALWGPLLKGKFADRADDVGMVWLWGKIYLRFASRQSANAESLGYLEGSFRGYYSALAKLIEERGGPIHLNTPVERLVVEDGAVTGLVQAGGEFHAFDQVLMTLPNILVKRIAPDLPAAYVEVLDRVRYQWATCLVLALDQPLTNYYWLSIADPLPFVACVEHTNFMPKERYDNNHVVYFSNYTSPGHPVLEMDAEQVIDYYFDGIKKLNPKFDKSWIKQSWFFKDPGGQPVITTNYSHSIPDMRTGIKGLYLSNTTQVYPEDRGQNYSLLLGEKVAKMMHEDGGGYLQAAGM